MTRITHRLALGVGAVALVVAAAGVYVAARDQNTNQPPAPFMGGRGGPGGRMGGDGPMGLLPMFGRQLDLTSAQRDQIRAVADSHRDEWKALADRARTAHQALMDAVTADSGVDEGLIRQKSADVAAIEADMAVARAHAFAEVSQILTADQKAKLKDLKAQAAAGGGRRGHGGR
jgi:Spy/CpxP family protein refolding chaperone